MVPATRSLINSLYQREFLKIVFILGSYVFSQAGKADGE